RGAGRVAGDAHPVAAVGGGAGRLWHLAVEGVEPQGVHDRRAQLRHDVARGELEGLLLERHALALAEVARGLAEDDHREDVCLLERRVGGERELGLLARPPEVDGDAIVRILEDGGDVERRIGWRGTLERDRALLLEREPATLEDVPTAEETDGPDEVDALSGRLGELAAARRAALPALPAAPA